MKSKATLKNVIIGLDGATFDVILPFIKEKKLPTFARLIKDGAWGDLESTTPPITASAWTSFMTGENPGKHGIIDFFKVTPEGLAKTGEVVSTDSIAGRTFFDVMSGFGMRVGVITVPVTYPPWDINGIMISGYPSPDNNKIYSLSNEISIDIKEPLNFSAEYYRVSTEEQILEDCLSRDKLRADLMFDLLNRYEFDCFVLVMGGIDRAQHDYWKYHDPEYPMVEKEGRGKFRNAIFSNYKLADEVLSKLLESYGKDVNLFIMSDHGSGRRPFSFFNVNSWLKQNGMLKINRQRAVMRKIIKKAFYGLNALVTPKNKKSSPVLQKIRSASRKKRRGIGRIFDWSETRAYYYPLMYPAGGIMINLKGRQPNGIVNPGMEYDQLVADIIGKLGECYDEKTGNKVITKVYSRDDLYHGPFTVGFPDIIFNLNLEYESCPELFDTTISPVPNFILSMKSGYHLMNGIFIAHGSNIKSNKVHGARIIDIAPTVLYSSGLKVPDHMDGEVLNNVFTEEFSKQNPIQNFNWKSKISGSKVSIEKNEQRDMEEKLKALGYL